MTRVDTFSDDITVRMRETEDELVGRDPRTVSLWTLNPKTGEWEAVPTSHDAVGAIARVSHFSPYGVGAFNALQMAPSIHGNEVDLYSGTAKTSIPIEVPAGPGGLSPSLSLTYDSGRVDAMRGGYSISSWAGEGWDLTTGSIKWEPPSLPGGPSRYFLEINGAKSEIVNVDGQLRLKDESFYKIERPSGACASTWRVTDKSGTAYSFGCRKDENDQDQLMPSAIRYYDYASPYVMQQTYQWDLSQVRDTHGNKIDYTYDQVKAPYYIWNGSTYVCQNPDCKDYVRSSYPHIITYDNGNVTVHFNTSDDGTLNWSCWYFPFTPLIVRNDTGMQTVWACTYRGTNAPIPLVTETKRLDSIEVKVGESLVRKYTLQHITTQAPGYSYSDGRDAGSMILTSLTLWDGNGSQSLYTSSYAYEDRHSGWWCGSAYGGGQHTRPYLTILDNGFGGKTLITYNEEPSPKLPGCYWTRETVTEQRQIYGAGQPDTVTSYDYRDESDNPSGPNYAYVNDDPTAAEYRGFGQVSTREGQGKATLRPNSNAGPNNWYDQYPSGSPHYSIVNGTNPGYIEGSAGQTEAFGLDDTGQAGIPSGSTIDKIVLRWNWDGYIQPWMVGPASVYAFVRTNGQNSVSPERFTTDTGIYKDASHTWAKNPATGGDWTTLALDSLQIGLIVYDTSPGEPRVTQLSVDVYYRSPGFAVNPVKHYFYTTGSPNDDARTGREKEVRSYGGDLVWRKTVNTWNAQAFGGNFLYGAGNLASWVDWVQTDLPVTGISNLYKGDIIKIDSEQMEITADPEGNMLTVARGVNGTEVTSHDSGRPLYKWDNFSSTYRTLYSAVDSTTTTLPVSSAQGFSVGEAIRIDNEQMGVTAVDAQSQPNTLSVARRLNGTLAVSHSAEAGISRGSPAAIFTYLHKVQDYPYKEGTADAEKYIKTTYDSSASGYGEVSTEIDYGLTQIVNGIETYSESDQQMRISRVYRTSGFTGDPYLVPLLSEKTYALGSNTLLSATYYFYDGDCLTEDTLGTMPIPRGDLTAVARQVTGGNPGESRTFSTTYYSYDSNGNLTKVSEPRSESDPVWHPHTCGEGWEVRLCFPVDVAWTEATYDDTYHTYHVSVSKRSPGDNPLPQTTIFGYDYVLGKVTSQTEPSGLVAHIAYDTFGRPTKVWDNFDSETYPTKQFEYHWGAASAFKWTTTWQRSTSGTSTHLGQIACFDGFGRQVQTRVLSTMSSADTVEAIKYNSRGLQEWSANYSAGRPSGGGCANFESKPKTVTTYDPLGNVTSVTNPDTPPTSRTEDHSGLTTTFIDENAHKKTSTMNSFGQTVELVEYTGTDPYATTRYTYDRLGNLTTLRDTAGNETTMGYDMLGRKTWMDDMDMGGWSYEYGAAGNITEQTNARQRATTLQYDALGRLTSKTGDGISVTYSYDTYDDTQFCAPPTSPAGTALGQATKMVDSSGTTRWCYDLRGRIVKERKTVDGVNYDITRTYDSADRVRDLYYPDRVPVTRPDGEHVLNSYWDDSGFGSHGLLKKVESVTYGGSYLTTAWYDFNRLQVSQLSLGTSPVTATDYGYDSRGRVTNIESAALHLDYEYDGVGNVHSITDNIAAEVTTFTYDELNRLTGASGGYGASYSYSPDGKLLVKAEARGYIYSYDDADHKHAATLATSATGPFRMTYDANGNMATENGETFTYNGDNQLVTRTAAGATITYTYDGKGTLVKKSSTDGTWTVYIGGIYEKHQDGSYVTYYNAFGRRIAMRTHTGPSDPGTVYYLLADQLGSTSTILSATATVEQRAKYYPYGSMRSGSTMNSTITDKHFTGQQDEGTAFGLYDYGARFYSTTLGRFISADPTGNPGNPRSLDRYAYVFNNPLKYTDPTGLRAASGLSGLAAPSHWAEFRRWISATSGSGNPTMKASSRTCRNCGPPTEADILGGLNQWYGDLRDRGYSHERALEVMYMVGQWAGYYQEKGETNPNLRQEDMALWLEEMWIYCPECFHYAGEYQPGELGGIVGVNTPEPFPGTDCGRWWSSMCLVHSANGGEPPSLEFQSWEDHLLDATTAMQRSGLNADEILLMPWSHSMTTNSGRSDIYTQRNWVEHYVGVGWWDILPLEPMPGFGW